MSKEYYELLKGKVQEGNYIKEDMIALIEKRRVEDKITEEARDTLLQLIETCHNPSYKEQVTQDQVIKNLYSRCDDLEMAVMDLASLVAELIGGAK